MMPDLLTLQLMYGQALYEAERWRVQAELLQKQIADAAQEIATQAVRLSDTKERV